MGKASSETIMVRQTHSHSQTKKKKRGRPSLSDLQHRKFQHSSSNPNPNSSIIFPNSSPQIPNSHFPPNPNLPRRARSSRRTTPNLPPDFVHFDDDDDDHDEHDEEFDDDDDDDRVKKKVKLVGGLPSNSTSFRSPIVNAGHEEDEKVWKGTDTHTQNGTTTTRMLDVGPTIAAASSHTPLPGNKKLLLLILDKLQKKDTRGVFAEPVDPEELPDYHEYIEHPMDFGTVKKKLDGGLYKTLEQLEADINLICTNAMEYNAPNTIYFRQARSIQELAKKEFEALRQDGGNSEPPPKPRRGRPPGSRNMKKLLESSPLDRGAAGESSSDATPVSRDDDTTVKSNSYNLRKGPSLYRFPRNLETSFDYTASASKSVPMKYGEKLYDSEENRRETYNPFGEGGSGQDQSLSSSSTIFAALDKKLIPVGLEYEHSYARSLARFAQGLGPIAWRIASKKLREVLPPGVDFGPGWVGENKTSTTRVSPLPEISVQSDSISQDSSLRSETQHYPSTSGFASPPVTHNRPSSLSTMETSRSLGSFAPFHQMIQQTSRSLGPSRMQVSPSPMGMDFQGTLLRAENDSLGMHGVPYWQNVSMQERWDLPYQVEQNTGFQASDARSSSLPVGSPPPLDLVLQL